jgi:hypothetical protein
MAPKFHTFADTRTSRSFALPLVTMTTGMLAASKQPSSKARKNMAAGGYVSKRKMAAGINGRTRLRRPAMNSANS